MLVELPVAVIVAQWMVLLALGFLVLIVYRQLGVLMELKERRHQSTKEMTGGLALGARVPAFDYWVIEAGLRRVESWRPGAPRGTILLFGDPLCASCENALAGLENLAKTGRLGTLECLVVTSESPEIVEAVDAFRNSILPVVHVEKEVIINTFALQATPYLLLVDAAGLVAASGPAYDEKTIVRLVRHQAGPLAHVLEFVHPGDNQNPLPSPSTAK